MSELEKEIEEEELIIVEDQDEEDEKPVEKPAAEDSDDDDDEDTRLGGDETDDGDEERRERRRVERLTRKQRQKEARERTERKVSFLEARNKDLEDRLSGIDAKLSASELSDIDRRIAYAKSQIKNADAVIASAVEAGNGQDLVEAQNIRDEFRDNLVKLDSYKQSTSNPRPKAPDPTIVNFANEWHSKNRWWDPSGGDSDSLRIKEIDDDLSSEGYDPKSQSYWDELTKRGAESMPHRFKEKAKPEPTPEGEGPRNRTGGAERKLKPNEVRISADRKQALIDLGVWDDPQERARYVKQYAEYDRRESA